MSVQHPISRGRAIEVAYVGSRGHDLISARDMNQPPPSPQALNLRTEPVVRRHHPHRIARRSQLPRAPDPIQAAAGPRHLGDRQYTLGQVHRRCVGILHERGRPELPAEQSRPRRRTRPRHLRRPPPFTAAGPATIAVQEREGDAGQCGWLSKALGDWRCGWCSPSRPAGCSPRRSHPDIDASNTGRLNLGFGYNDRPNVTGNPAFEGVRSRRDPMVRHRGFLDAGVRDVRQLGQEHAGRAGVPGTSVWPCSKLILLGAARLQARFEVFNLLNTTNLDLTDAFLGSPTFGQVLSAGSPRRMQLGVRVLF